MNFKNKERKNFLKKIYFTEICLVLLSTYLTLLFINFLIVQNKIKNENDKILNRLENAKKNFKLVNNQKTYFPYLIINHETNKFDEILQKYKILPLSSISNKDILLCNENGNPATYLSDDYGFRNNNSVYFNKEEKIIFLGDSFILGFCHNDKTIANIVSKNLFNKNILNLSQGGTGPLIQSAILREYSDNVKFNTVFWFLFTGNDFANLSDEINNDYLNKYLKPNYSQRLKTKQEDIDNIYLEYIII